MRGLLCKDFILLKKQTKIFAIIFLMLLGFHFFGDLDSSFIMGYLPFVFSSYIISSISYDECNNGLSFLLVLPVSRKSYVVEKYLFGICMGGFGSLVAWIFLAIIELKHTEMAGFLAWLPESIFLMALVFCGIGIFISIILPVQLKFGSEKGRMVIFGIIFAIMGGGYLLFQLLQNSSVDFKAIAQYFNQAESGAVLTVAAFCMAVTLAISYGSSLRIMEKKQL